MRVKYINAGAGSGKTYRLTHLLADKLVPNEKDVKPVKASRIILTTFTNAAAADFVRKAREVLINEKHSPGIAAELDSALIGTVHSVCERFVQKYWYRLGLTLPLNIASGDDKELYVSRTAENVAGDDDVKYFTKFARDYDMDPDFWKEYLKGIVEMKYNFGVEGFSKSLKASCDDIADIFKADATDMDACLDAFLNTMLSSIEEINRRNEANGKRLLMVKEQKEAKSLLTGASHYKKAAKVYAWALEGSQKTKGFWNTSFDASAYSLTIDAARRVLLSKEAGKDLQKCVEKLFGLADKWEKKYIEFKKENRLLDFNDQEQKFIKILYDEGFDDIRDDIRKSYDVMMVDEFQDSNPVQIKIFRKMMELVKETVFVGDRKQAIFGFRGTESSLVDDFIEGILDLESLKKSFRSRPELVDAANDVFCNAFDVERQEVFPDDDDKPYDSVSLKAVRPARRDMEPALQMWLAPLKSERSERCNYVAVGMKIREIVDSGKYMVVRDKDQEGNEIVSPIQFRDIAVLLRRGSGMNDVVKAFRDARVPVSIQEKDFLGWAEVQLVLSLLRYVMDPGDKCAKADIHHLIGGDSVEKIVIDTASGLETDQAKNLFKHLSDIRSRVSVLSVSEIVESVIMELDMYGNTISWGLPEIRTRNLGFLAGLARKYEKQCSGMNTTPTLAGYISYISDYKPEGHPVDGTNTVKVLTYHSSKGLEWPMVILDELDSLDISDQEIFNKEFSGVRHFRLDDQVLLHVFPKVLSKRPSKDFYAKSPNMPEPVMDKLKATKFFSFVKNRKVEEERRLLYVGFTRAKDYLVALGNPKSRFTWPVLCNSGRLSEQGTELIWHPNHPYSSIMLPSFEVGTPAEGGSLLPWNVPAEMELDEKYQSPSLSGHRMSVPTILTEVFRGGRMEQNIPEGKSDICGTCIHHIFAAFDINADRKEMVDMAGRIIEGMGLAEAFPSPESVIDSAEQFFGWIQETYGPGIPLHELPFMMRNDDGTIVRGEMDFVWQLSGGESILVDFKSYHGIEDFDDPDARSKYYGYVPQLKAYKETLEAGKFIVRDVFVYYFVQGRIIRFAM